MRSPSKPQWLWDKKGLPRRLSGVRGSMLKPSSSPLLNICSHSQFPCSGLMSHNTCWVWANTYTSTHALCVGVCLYRQGRDVLGRGTIRNQTSFSAKDKFNSILLVFGSGARVNHSAAWLAVAAKLPRTAAQLLSSLLSLRQQDSPPFRGQRSRRRTRTSSYTPENSSSKTAASFLSQTGGGMYRNIRRWFKEDADRNSQSFWRL